MKKTMTTKVLKISPQDGDRKGCIAHTLQLVVNDSIRDNETAKPLLENLQKWINFFRKSPKWTEELKAKTDGRDIKLMGGIRWNALFYGLERFAEVRNFRPINLL